MIAECPATPHTLSATAISPKDWQSGASRTGASTLPKDKKVKVFNMILMLRKGEGDKPEVLLGHKARGFAVGLWNGFGGKVETDKDASIASSSARELWEESGLNIPRDSLQRRAVIWFHLPELTCIMEVHVYVAWIDDAVKGHPAQGVTEAEARQAQEETEGKKDGVTVIETEEMNPISWVGLDALPLDKMWADDEYWLHPLLRAAFDEKAGARKDEAACTLHGYQPFVALFDFEEGMKVISKMQIQPVPNAAGLSALTRNDTSAVATSS